ncbi:hypothetical protein RvY_16872, partial [Ramazzottius varieornatus]
KRIAVRAKLVVQDNTGSHNTTNSTTRTADAAIFSKHLVVVRSTSNENFVYANRLLKTTGSRERRTKRSNTPWSNRRSTAPRLN